MAKKTTPKGLNSEILSLYGFDSPEETIVALKNEARKLRYCCLKVWRRYLSSYKPSHYAVHKTGVKGKRTGHSAKSIQIGGIKQIDFDEIGIEVTFTNDLAYHDSVMGGREGHAIMLISQGWKVKKGKHKNVYRFGYYEGFDYLGEVQRMYDGIKDKRVSLEIQWLGNEDYTR